MAITSQFAYTNTAAHAFTVTPTDVKPVTVYGKTADLADKVVLENKTTPLDQGERLTYTCTQLDKVTSTQNLVKPALSRAGVQYVIKLEEILRTADGADLIQDEPVVAYLTIRHQSSSYITSSLVEEVFKRLVGACYKEDGTSRFDDLMRSALVPVAD